MLRHLCRIPVALFVFGAATLFQQSPVDAGEYAGSAECAGCHTQIYNDWRETRHAYSLRTADEARRADYPLPAEAGSWDDLSFVIGGRQRISYADRAGQVLGVSYHQRLGQWAGFPETQMGDCGPCHLTGFRAGESREQDPAIAGSWAEHNIGCESCHGPGQLHSDSLEAADINIDPSSRACGNCHTAAGRILPKDDRHETHDLVQVWNRDPHVTGVRFQSHNGFCAGCHSPYEGSTSEPGQAAAIRSFSESRGNVTCIACHDPHRLANQRQTRERLVLEPPHPPRRQAYTGNDRDFTTTDYDEQETTEENCRHCHRGADEIDLDHADATCNDCHNTFARNRTRESRVFQDVNHGELTCSPCHADADHLISILYRDPDFLQPENLHDLRRLPREVIERYDFRYPDLQRRRPNPLAGAPGRLTYPAGVDDPAVLEVDRSPERRHAVLVRLLGRQPHARLAARGELAEARAELARSPETPGAFLQLALAYARLGEERASREILQYAAGKGATAVFGKLMLASGAPAASPALSFVAPAPGSVGEPLRLWLLGFIALIEGRSDDAEELLTAARRLDPREPGVGVLVALARLGSRRMAEAIETLEELVDSDPGHVPSRIALGALLINSGRLGSATRQLEAAVAADPTDPLARYFLGRAVLRGRDDERATRELRAAVAANPGLLDARFHLARAYRRAGYHGAAADTYGEIIRERPDLFHPHRELGEMYKYLGDRLFFTLAGAREAAPPVDVEPARWRRYLLRGEQRSAEYAELALTELRRAGESGVLGIEEIRQISEIFRRAGRHAEARECFEWLAAREPSNWLHPYRLGTILVRQRRFPEARRQLARARELAPVAGDPYVALGLVSVLTGRVDEAVRTYEEATIHEPFNPALYTNLGAAQGSLGNYSKARSALERALELDTFPLPRVHLAWTDLALVHLHEGNRERAVWALKNALHRYPDYGPARKLLSEIGDRERRPSVDFVYNDTLEIFGEVTTVANGDE